MTVPPPFQRFLDDHRDDVWRLLVSSVGRDRAEDCFQETFMAALRAYPSLRPGSNLRAWVLTIAQRKALDAHRARARAPLPVAHAAEGSVGVGRSASGVNGASAQGIGRLDAPPPDERDEQLWSAVRKLPERQRSAVVLRCLADLPHRQIAAAIGCSEAAARRSLHEGLATLREAMADA